MKKSNATSGLENRAQANVDFDKFVARHHELTSATALEEAARLGAEAKLKQATAEKKRDALRAIVAARTAQLMCYRGMIAWQAYRARKHQANFESLNVQRERKTESENSRCHTACSVQAMA